MFPPTGFILAASLILGVALEGSGFFLPIAIFLAGSISIAWLWTDDHRVLGFGVLCLLIAIIGMLRVGNQQPFPEAPPNLERSTTFSGVVIEPPRQYPTATHARFDVADPYESRVWAQLPPFPQVEQGDVLQVTGRFIANENTSFRGFSAQRDTTGLLQGERVVVVENEASLINRTRSSVGREIRDRLRQRVPEPAGAFSTGVILGDDGAMTEATRDSFRVGGLTHMTAVSGVHVGIIAGALLLISKLGLVNRWWMLGVSVPVIWSFAYLVGMRPSVVRASLMLTLLLAAHFLGRPRDTLNAVGLAAAAMLLIDPSFRHDIGFQLSVAATTGIALGILLIGNRSHWNVVWVVPTAAQLATEPLILYHFGYYSLVSPLANIVATPFLAITMAMSILTVTSSLLSSTLADALAIATWAPAYAVVMIADIAARAPYLSNDVRPLGLSGVWTAYAILCGFIALLFVILEPESEETDGDLGLLYRV